MHDEPQGFRVGLGAAHVFQADAGLEEREGVQVFEDDFGRRMPFRSGNAELQARVLQAGQDRTCSGKKDGFLERLDVAGSTGLLRNARDTLPPPYPGP